MFDNNSGFDANETSFVGRDSAAIRDPYGLDFNNDGRSDLLWHNPASGENVLWLTEGDEGAQIGDRISLRSTNENWQVEAAADFNRDGHTDLLVRNERTGDNAAWFMGGENDAQRVGRDGITGIGSDWEVQGVGDFDDDNQADILWRNARTGKNVVWYMEGGNGTQVRERRELRSPGQRWEAKGVADFNGDGRSDVLWRNERTGENLVWYLKGDKGTDYKDSERIESYRESGWTLEGVGDFNRDSDPDLLWREQSSGETVVWQMGGAKNNRIEDRVRFSGLEGAWTPIVEGWSPEGIAGSDVYHSDNDHSDNDHSDHDHADHDHTSHDHFGHDHSADEPLDLPEELTPSKLVTSGAEKNGFNIEFDYRFDTNNWYDREKREVLEKAADIWEAIILDDFENIKVGTTVHASDPNGNGLTSFKLTSEIDDVRVFAFAQDLTSNRSLAEAGATTYKSDRNTSTVFQPWLGEIVFNSKESWFVDADTSRTPDIESYQADMLSVAVHELGHILGISSGIDAFRSLIKDGRFTGEAATALNDGNAIPLDRRGSHIRDDFEIAGLGENSLDPNIKKGSRKLLTALDVALLEDIGYSVDYSTVKRVPELEVLSIQEGGKDITELRTNNSYTVRWQDNLAEEVKIDLYEGDRYIRTLVNSTPSTGEFSWYVTPELAGDGFYWIKISSTENEAISDKSGRPFRIGETPYINIDTPSDNYPLKTNASFELTWSDNIKETVKIELFKDGSYYRTITASTSSDGRYTWNIPNYLETSRNYHLRFTSTSDSSVYDESGKFWIQKD